MSARRPPAGLAPRARVVDVLAQPGAGLRDGGGRGSQTRPGAAVGDDLERAARVGRRDDRLLGQERLVRDHPEVLVDGRVVDGEAARVEVGELLLVDAAGERRAAVEAVPLGELLEPLAVGPVADDHAAQRRVGGERLEQQVDALRAVEPADGEDEVVVARRSGRRAPAADAASPRPRAGRALEPLGDVARGREQLPRLAERDAVEPLHARRIARSARRLAELAELGAVELVRLAELVQRARRPCSDGGRRTTGTSSRSRGRSARPSASVRSSSRQRNACVSTRSPGYHLNGTVTRSASCPRARQLGGQVVREDLGAAARERHLRAQTAILI